MQVLCTNFCYITYPFVETHSAHGECGRKKTLLWSFHLFMNRNRLILMLICSKYDQAHLTPVPSEVFRLNNGLYSESGTIGVVTIFGKQCVFSVDWIHLTTERRSLFLLQLYVRRRSYRSFKHLFSGLYK